MCCHSSAKLANILSSQMTRLHGTFRRSDCHFRQVEWQKKTLISGNCLVAPLQLYESLIDRLEFLTCQKFSDIYCAWVPHYIH